MLAQTEHTHKKLCKNNMSRQKVCVDLQISQSGAKIMLRRIAIFWWHYIILAMNPQARASGSVQHAD